MSIWSRTSVFNSRTSSSENNRVKMTQSPFGGLEAWTQPPRTNPLCLVQCDDKWRYDSSCKTAARCCVPRGAPKSENGVGETGTVTSNADPMGGRDLLEYISRAPTRIRSGEIGVLQGRPPPNEQRYSWPRYSAAGHSGDIEYTVGEFLDIFILGEPSHVSCR
jgi:hypothetical protein